MGSRDRSWGIRPVGEPEPAGRPDTAFGGMWWLYLPLAFDDYQIFLIIQEDPDGHRSLYDCTRRWRDGRVEQLDGVRATIHYTPGTRIPHGAHVEMMNRGPGTDFSSTSSRSCSRPSPSGPATAATPRGRTARGRAGRSPNASPTT